jgi:hypothetical protein
VRRWIFVTLVAVVVASAALVGVFVVTDSDGGSARQFGGIPVAAGVVRSEGTELPNGFSVAKGSALIGDVFPNSVVFLGTYKGVPIPNPGWSAVLLVTGDPRQVMADYRRQAIEAGLAIDAGSCGFDDNERGGVYRCEAAGVPRVSIWIMRGEAPFGAMSHMVIAYSGDEASTSSDRSSPHGTVPPISGPPPPPVPTRWEQLARPGDFVFGDSPKAPLSYMAPPFRVEPGSEVAAPIAPLGTYGSYDWTAILHVTGDPAQVADEYRTQLNARSKTFGTVGEVIKSQPVAGTTMYEFGADNLGAWDYRFEVLDGPHGSWMRVRAGAQT